MPSLSAFRGKRERDLQRARLSVPKLSWLLGVSVREYRELEAGEGWPTWQTWDRMVKLYGWPQTFAGGD